jgi:predicted dehydrogenase
VGMKFRFYTMAQKICRLIPSPYAISVQVTDDPWPADFWANDPLIGGGHVLSQGVHGTDLLRFLAGSEPVSAFAIGANYHQPTQVIDNLNAVFRFANNTAGSLLATDCGQPPGIGKFLVQVYGKEGSAVLSDRLTRLAFHDLHSGRRLHYEGTEDGFLEENRAFAQLLLGQAAAVSTIRDGCIAQAMIEAAMESSRSGNAQPILLN